METAATSICLLWVSVLLWVSPIVARQSAATQEAVEQCVSLGEAPMPEDRVFLYDELHYVTKNPFLWVRSRLDDCYRTCH